MSRVKIDTRDYEPVVQLLAKLSTLDDERKSWFLGFAAGVAYGSTEQHDAQTTNP